MEKRKTKMMTHFNGKMQLDCRAPVINYIVKGHLLNGFPAWAYRTGGEGAPAPPPVCWANKASRAIFASHAVGQYWLIIKINGTNSVNFVGNMLSNRNFS